MKLFAKKIILGLGLLTACLLPASVSAREFPRFEWHHLTGIVGHVDFSTSTNESSVNLALQTEGGTTVAVISNFAVPVELQQPDIQYITITEDRTFVAFVQPGHYVLKGFVSAPPGAGLHWNSILIIPAVQVTVDRDRLTIVDVKDSLGKL